MSREAKMLRQNNPVTNESEAIFMCCCPETEHQIWIMGCTDYMFLLVSMPLYKSLLQRLWVAIKYIINPRSDSRFFEETMISKATALELGNFILEVASKMEDGIN